MKHVLIIKLWALGDILMATPMIAALRARWPDVQITWAVESSHAELLAGHPGIDYLLPVDTVSWRRMLKRGRVPAWMARAASLRRDMRRRRFDAVINCHPDKWWSSVLCAASRRVGLYPTETLSASRVLYTHALGRPKVPPLHNTDHYLTATQALGCPDAGKALTIGETPDEAHFVAEFLRQNGLHGDAPLVVLAPFSNGANRCWEPERYAALAERLHRDCDAQIVMTLASGDVGAAQSIKEQADAPITLAIGTTLRQYVGLLRRADLVISGDSSPMHIAAAVGTPFVALFGPTPIAERVPLEGRGMALALPLPCAPCDLPTCANPIFRQCMRLIAVDDVLAAAVPFLKDMNAPVAR